MSLFDSLPSFIEGVKSVIDASGAIQGTITDSISNGIERAFKRIRTPLEQSILKVAFTLVGVFFVIWGAALVLDNFMPYDGLGFVIVGAFFGIITLLFFQENKAGQMRLE